jgi:coenzyme F420-reducing hydrogenase delta subunit
MVEAMGIYYDALLLEKEALEKKDQEWIQQSNAKGEEYVNALNEFHEEMEKLAKEYGIDYQKTQWIR